jgi:dTDP-4-dehydrorhamnose 3,5-epimerase
MIFKETPLSGAYLVEVEKHIDSRGFFARTWCEQEFSDHGMTARVAQCNLAFNEKRHTVRGMHFQRHPHTEAKLVRCTRGRVLDVVVDLRKSSPSYKAWFGVELSDQNRRALYVPEGLAHGYMTLCDNTEILYQVSAPYHPESESGVRWNDKAFGIVWPCAHPVISKKDAAFPDYGGETL